MIGRYVRYVNGYKVWTDLCTLIATIDLDDRKGLWGEELETGKVLRDAPFRYPFVLPYLEPPELSNLVNITLMTREQFLDLLALSNELTRLNNDDTELYDRNLFGDVGLDGYYSAFVPSRVHKVLSEAERQGFDIDTIEVVSVPGGGVSDGTVTYSPAILRFSGMGFIGAIGVAGVKSEKAKIFKLF